MIPNGGAARLARALGLAVAACGVGAAGLGLEVLLVSLAGLALGYGRAGALGIALFIAGWALGARAAGGWRGSAPRALLACGSAVAAGAWLLVPALLWTSSAHPGSALAGALAVAALLAVALPQGALLPTLLRGWRGGGGAGVAVLFSSSFAGSALGATWLGYALPAAFGRMAAAGAAGALALVAAALGAAALRGVRGPGPAEQLGIAERAPPRLSPRRAGLALALLTGWVAAAEWIGLRIGVLWLGGMQPALTAILTASLAALGAGAFLLPTCLARRPWRVPALFALCACSWPALIVASHLIPAELGRSQPLTAAVLLVGAALLPFGAAVPLLHREVSGPRAPALGRLLGWEALGALVGVPLTHFYLVPVLGSDGALGIWTLLAALFTALALRPLGAASWVAVAVCALAGSCALFLPRVSALGLARLSPPLSNPALTVLDVTEDEHFCVAVVHDGLLAERTLLTDGFRAAATGDDYLYMRVLGHLPLLLHDAPRNVAVLAFGTGTTAGSVSLHPQVQRLDVLELSRAVAERAHWFEESNRGVLADLEGALAGRGGVRLLLGDGRRRLAERPGTYDVLTMEPLLPDSPFAVYLYTAEFYAVARRALAPGGLVCQWVPPQALEPETFEATLAAFTQALPWSSIWVFGTQVLLVGGESQPRLAAGRFPREGALREALVELGLEEPADLLARFVLPGEGWPAAARPLSDRDPWICYRPARRSERLLDLPRNLARLRALEGEPPAAWMPAAGPAAAERLLGVRWLRRAREAWAVERAARLGVPVPAQDLERDLEGHLAQARSLLGAPPELVALERESSAGRARSEGLALLARDGSPGAARAAALVLREAARHQPERADAHLYMALAFERMGELAAAEQALALALELCPRLMETPPGRNAAKLGFPTSERLRAALIPKSRRAGA